jgi:hypothetical protein
MAVLSPDRRCIATFREKDAHLTLWDVATGKRVAEADVAGLLDLPSIYLFYDLKFRNTNEGEGNRDYTVTVSAEDALPPPGSASPPADTIVYWETKSGRLRKERSVETSRAEDIEANSPDGSLTAASEPGALDDREEFVHLRNTHTGQVIRVLRGNGGPLPPRSRSIPGSVMRVKEQDGQ